MAAAAEGVDDSQGGSHALCFVTVFMAGGKQIVCFDVFMTGEREVCVLGLCVLVH